MKVFVRRLGRGRFIENMKPLTGGPPDGGRGGAGERRGRPWGRDDASGSGGIHAHQISFDFAFAFAFAFVFAIVFIFAIDIVVWYRIRVDQMGS